LEDLDVGGRIILISILNCRMEPCGVESSGSGWDNWPTVPNTVMNFRIV